VAQDLTPGVTARQHLESYLNEFIWRKHVGADVFGGLLQTISAL